MADSVIDVHAHVVPATLLADLADRGRYGFRATRTGDGWVVSVPGIGDTRPIRPRMTEPAARQSWLAGAGITRQVLAPWLDIQSGHLGPADARAWAQRLNDALRATVAEADTVGLATVALDDGEQAAKDLGEALNGRELTGLLLNTNPLGDRQLHDPGLEPLWAAAAELGAPVLLHPPTCGPSGALRTLGGLGNVYGRLVDNTFAVTEIGRAHV